MSSRETHPARSISTGRRRPPALQLPARLLLGCLLTCGLTAGCNSRAVSDLAKQLSRQAVAGKVAAKTGDAGSDAGIDGAAAARALTSAYRASSVSRDSASSAGGSDLRADGPAAELRRQCLAELQQHKQYPFDFQLTSLDGQPLSLGQFAGRVTILDLWGTWCPPCRREIPHLVDLHQRYADAGLAVVGVNYERTGSDAAARQSIDAFTRDQPITFPLALGTDALRDQIPGFRGYPTTLMIDRGGRVRATLVGARSLEFLETMVQLLLDEPGGPSLGGLAAAAPPQATPPSRAASVVPNAPPGVPRIQVNPFAIDTP